MDYKKRTDTLNSLIEQLKMLLGNIREIEDIAMDIEREVGSIDSALPDADRLRGDERAQVLHLYDLTAEAFSLADQILGPPDDEVTGESSGKAYMPEARGNDGDVSLDDLIVNLKINTGRHLS